MAISSVAGNNIENPLESAMIHAVARVLAKHAVPQSPAEVTWIAEKVSVNTNLMNMIRFN